MIVVVSGASGSGKSTLSKRLIRMVPDSELSISFTTRAPRGRERDGVHYHFVGDDEFDRRIKRGDFAEWARVHGKRYGTSMSFVKKQLASGNDVVCDIDVQGGFALQKRFPKETVLVFVLPPSMKELEKRLRGRGTDSAEAVRRRIETARKEHRLARKYDYLLVNRNLGETARTLAQIVRAERCRTDRVLPGVPAGLGLGGRRRKRS